MPKILVSDPIAQEGIDLLKKRFTVDVKIGMDKDQLIAIIGDYDALAIRSETKATADVLEAAKKLKIIGRAGVGVDNIDIPAATQKGILVVNSPSGNTYAAAELTMAMMLSLSRNITQGHNSLRAGEWKRSKFVGNELYGKTLGIYGLGKIGTAVAKRAKSFEMSVIGFDPFISAEYAEKLGIDLVSFDELLQKSDFLTLHVPATKETKGSIGAEQIAKMKHGVRVINVARGGIIDEAALCKAVEEGRVAGVAFDVYEKEPPPADNPLLKLDNALTTPHLGASTAEAQINVSIDVAEQIIDVLEGRPARSAVNMPAMSAEELSSVAPFITLGERIGSLASQLSEGPIASVEIDFCGELSSLETEPVLRAVLRGVLQPILVESVNLVNAPVLAESRGIKVMESRCIAPEAYTSLLIVTVKTNKGEKVIQGTLFGKRDIRIVKIDGYEVDLVPEGYMLVSVHTDRPGVIGSVGTLLGSRGINIGGMHVGRGGKGKPSLMVLNIDTQIPEPVLKSLSEVESIVTANLIQLS